MTLLGWMQNQDIDIQTAADTFDCSIYAIRKWIRGERCPRPAMQAKIKRLTGGAVTGDDWLPAED